MRGNACDIYSVFASAEGEGRGIIDSGTCARDVTWILYDDGELVFSGTGVIPPCYNVEQGYDRWSKYFPQVKVITIQDGIRGISKEAFATDKGIASASLYKITIPDSVTYIGEDIVDAKLMSAQNGERLSAICFAGSEEKWNSFFQSLARNTMTELSDAGKNTLTEKNQSPIA